MSAQLNPAEPASPGLGGQFLTFHLGGEEYGVDILKVREIRGWTPVTRIPNTPAYLRGVLNLRGIVVPVVDLRDFFGLERAPEGPTTVVIVLAIQDEGRERVVGIVVDAVSDVVDFAEGQMKPPPDVGGRVRTEFIRGLAPLGERMAILLDTDRLLSHKVALPDQIAINNSEG